jgi:hypothetical protein
MQGVRRLREKVSVVCLSRNFGGLLLRVCAESRELQHLDVIEDLPQGVCAGNLIEVELTLQRSGRIGL